MDFGRNSCLRAAWLWPTLVALCAGTAILTALDPAGDYPNRRAGPGLTVDEIFNVDQGVRLADRLFAGDFGGYCRQDAALHDHPPLGRLWIGLCHEAAYLIAPPRQPHSAWVVACARTASAVAFMALVVLIGTWTGRRSGLLAGAIAALALVLMPRVFGHAHLAALESPLNLVYAAAVLAVAAWAEEGRPPSTRRAACAGLLFGLALLTKIQAVLLPLPIAVWALCNWKRRGIGPLAVWGFTGAAVFVLGWPWLWSDSLEHLRNYLASSTNRSIVYVEYFGRKYADRDVPWHYPWVLFCTTVPIGLQALGVGGLVSGTERPLGKSPRELLLLACAAFPLVVFSLPGVAVYDGERLFLVSFPLWAIFVGRGGAAAFAWLRGKLSLGRSTAIAAVFLGLQAYGLVALAPFHLSYYNLLAGGLQGASRLGLQTTYWGDGVNRELLERTAELVPQGAVVDFVPVLHPYQLPALLSQAPELRAKEIRLRAFTGAPSEQPPVRYLLSFARREYLPESWNPGPPGARVLAEIRREGIRLAALYEMNAASPGAGE
jgi:4-amino-4-deoxy-L-arabinose transferase-like glycosyltransferase